MKALLIGCGEGGSKLVEMIMKIQRATCGSDENGEPIKKQFDALILNTALADLQKIDPDDKVLGKNRKLLVGSGYTPAAGHGAGGNPRLGALAATADSWRIAAKIEDVLSEIKDNQYMNDIEAFIVCAALGGGSGSGMGPVVAKLLKENYFEDQYPVIGLVILPAEEEGKLCAYNAYMSLLTWLRESNFDGIITVTLGGKFLNYRDDQEKYYARFDKSIAKALYILFGGETLEQDVNVDASDILSTIKDGGGICTLAHLSTKVHTPMSVKKEEVEVKVEERRLPIISRFRRKPEKDILKDLLSTEEEQPEEGWQATALLKLVKRACNKSNMFLPVDFKKAKAALMVVKDTEEFQVPTGALQAARRWVEENIGGIVRCTTISYRSFKLNTVDRDVFEEYEVQKEDDDLSENKTLEIAILFSGFKDVELFRKYKKTAEIVQKITSPSKGLRLVAESFGIPIGETFDGMYLPCSSERVNTAAMTQCKATIEAVNKFVKDLALMNPDLTEDEIRNGIEVLDVKPVPEEYTCEGSSLKEKIHECYEVKLKFTNKNDNTYFKRIYVIKVSREKIEYVYGGQKIIWAPPEFLRIADGWNRMEKQIISDVLAEALRKGKFKTVIGTDVGECDLYVTGIAKYPACAEDRAVSIYRVKVANINRIVMEIDTRDRKEREKIRRELVDSLSKNLCEGKHTEYFKYFYWISTDKQGVVWECEEFDRSRIVEVTRDTPIDREISAEASVYGKEEIEKVREQVADTCIYEDIRDSKYYEKLIRHPKEIVQYKSRLEELNDEAKAMIASIILDRGMDKSNEALSKYIKRHEKLENILRLVDSISSEIAYLKPRLKEKFETFIGKILSRFEKAIREFNYEECDKCIKLLEEILSLLSEKLTSEQQDAILKCLQSNRWKELTKNRIDMLRNIIKTPEEREREALEEETEKITGEEGGE